MILTRVLFCFVLFFLNIYIYSPVIDLCFGLWVLGVMRFGFFSFNFVPVDPNSVTHVY